MTTARQPGRARRSKWANFGALFQAGAAQAEAAGRALPHVAPPEAVAADEPGAHQAAPGRPADGPLVDGGEPAAPAPDAGEVPPEAPGEAPREAPGEAPAAAPWVRIRIAEGALLKARGHAARCCELEVGGLCVGTATREGPEGSWVVDIIDTFEAESTVNHRSSITFTADTWSAAHRTVERAYAPQGAGLVGWYHTHPGFGIFLSEGYDVFIHTNFFNQPWHVALVLDPLRNKEGFFAWHGQPPAIAPYPAERLEIVQSGVPLDEEKPGEAG